MSNVEINEVLLLEDRVELSTWLQGLLKRGFPGSKVDCQYSLEHATQRVGIQKFQLALVDLSLPDGSGIALIRALVKLQPECFIVVITIFDDSEHLLAALKAGAHGYLLKDESDEKLLDALRGVVDGKPPIAPRMAVKMLEYFRETEPKESILSEREREVLSLIAKGYSVKKAAEQLNVSWHTVGEHVKNIYKKLGINNRVQAAQQAQEMGL